MSSITQFITKNYRSRLERNISGGAACSHDFCRNYKSNPFPMHPPSSPRLFWGQMTAEDLVGIKFKADDSGHAGQFISMCEAAGYRWPGGSLKSHATRVFFFTDNKFLAWGYQSDFDSSLKREIRWESGEVLEW